MTFKKQLPKTILLLVGLWLLFNLVCYLVAESLWFEELGYLPAFWIRVAVQGSLAIFTAIATSSFWLGNIVLAIRAQYASRPLEKIQTNPELKTRGTWGAKRQEYSRYPKLPARLGLKFLLPLVILLGFLISCFSLYCWQLTLQVSASFTLLDSFSSPPLQLSSHAILQLFTKLLSSKLQLGLVIGLSLALAIWPHLGLTGLAILLSLCFAFMASSLWTQALLYLNPINFKISEPIFNQDISFYVFKLPVFEIASSWLLALFLYAFVSCLLIYILSGNSLSQGVFPGFSQQQQRHLSNLLGGLMFSIAFRFWLRRYELLYSQQGVNYGAGYTNVTVHLPSYTILCFFAGALAFCLLWNFFQNKWKIKRLKLLVVAFFAVYISLDVIVPRIVQNLVVQPNELAREAPYIKRSITFTRQGFDLNKIEVKTFDPAGKLTYADLQRNPLTISNIRLWDERPLLQSNRQLQQIRPYYKFLDADIDRYTLKQEEGKTGSQQVILAARELDYESVPEQAQTWVNENLVYTHGYGFTLSPVNTVGEGGLPDYFVKDIGVDTATNPQSSLGVTNEQIRASIPLGNPRIYYGEITNNPVMTPSSVQEFDYPSGEENVYNTYEGKGGISIAAWWRRLLFAKYLKNWQIVMTRDITPETKLLFRRNIQQRVRTIAPFLHYDSDPYLVVANANLQPDPVTGEMVETDNSPRPSENYLYWIVDAYTTSDRYPYSEPGPNPFNYIRNSVKVVIDAYNGTIDFYVADPSDPLIQSWIAIFPNMFKPLESMPLALRSHIRYPVDLFKAQSERLLIYHMADPQVFYNREDLWRVPNEIYGSEQQPVQPYYLIMKLPTEKSEEFILLLPFTPVARNNLIAWVAGRSDGDDYGKLLLYQFPKQRLVYGPEQIEALINQDPKISEQISLWNRQGSRAIQGNLLVIPIEQSLLYVEPLYLEASENSLPTLVRVIVAYENRIVMAETLNDALRTVFQVKPVEQPAIVTESSSGP